MGVNRIKTKDKGVEFDTFRKVTMTKKLKIRFVKFECALVMQILEQVGIFKATEHVQAIGFPAIGNKCIYLRGKHSEYDTDIGVIRFNDNAERDKYFNKVIKWISEEQFAIRGKLEIGKECEASDNGEDWVVRFFAGKSAKQLGEPRYLAYWYDNLGYLMRYKYVRPLASCVRPKIDSDVYTWEMEEQDER